MSRLAGRVCVVSGASAGIGRATCERFCAEGATVVGLSRSAPADGPGEQVALDVTEREAVEVFWSGFADRWGRLDGLVNVVGISGRRYGDGPLHECTDEGFDTVLETNLGSLFRMTRGALRQMLGQSPPGGSIVNVSSVLGFSPSPRLFATHAYAASKAGIIGLTRSAAAYYAPHRIRLNVLAPGLIRTPMADRAAHDAATLEYLRTKQPLTGDLGTAEDCAEAALYLISDASAFVTGQVLAVDGGWSVVG